MITILNYIRPLFSKILKPDLEVYKDVPYVPYGANKDQVMDLYVHRLGDNVSRPTALLIHGGGWSAGDKSVYEARARMYASAGFNVIAMNYTLATEDRITQWPHQLEDVYKVLLWIRSAKYDKDHLEKYSDLKRYITSDKVVVVGDSAGAHLALFTARNPNPALRADAVVNMFGPNDLTTPRLRNLLKDLWIFNKQSYEQHNDDYEYASPIVYMTKEDNICPIVTIHGKNDEVVEYHQAEVLQERLNYLGVPNKLITHNGTHDFNSIWKINQWWIELRALWWVLGVLK